MKQDQGNAIETLAHRAAMEAYLAAYVKALKGMPVDVLLGTEHEHVGVMNLSGGYGLECKVRVTFAKHYMSPEVVKGFKALSGIDLTKLPPKA